MSDLLDRLSAANPIADTAALTDAELEEATRVLAAALAADPEPRPVRRRPRRRRVLAPVAATALCAALVVALVSGVDEGGVQPATSAARALDRAADAAAARADDLQPGQYLYVRERNAYMSTFADARPGAFTAIVPHVRETWTAREGGGKYIERSGEGRFLGPRDRARWEAAGRPPLRAPTPTAEELRFPGPLHFANESVTYGELARKPTDGRAMYEDLKRAGRGAGNSPDEEVFVSVGDLLRTTPVPARVRAALYRALAYVKGIRFAGEVRDPAGRRGLAVELDGADNARHQLVFDPETSQLLAEQDVLAAPDDAVDAKPGTVIGYRVVLAAQVVDRLGQRP